MKQVEMCRKAQRLEMIVNRTFCQWTELNGFFLVLVYGLKETTYKWTHCHKTIHLPHVKPVYLPYLTGTGKCDVMSYRHVAVTVVWLLPPAVKLERVVYIYDARWNWRKISHKVDQLLCQLPKQKLLTLLQLIYFSTFNLALNFMETIWVYKESTCCTRY